MQPRRLIHGSRCGGMMRVCGSSGPGGENTDLDTRALLVYHRQIQNEGVGRDAPSRRLECVVSRTDGRCERRAFQARYSAVLFRDQASPPLGSPALDTGRRRYLEKRIDNNGYPNAAPVGLVSS